MPFTTYIIGAGASAPFGVPVASELPRVIHERIPAIARGILGHAASDESLLEARSLELNEMCEFLSLGNSTSLDAYLDTPRGRKYVEIGGMHALCHVLVSAERAGIRRIRQPFSDRDWLGGLCREVLVGDGFECRSDWSVVTFNYDRLIEFAIAATIHAREDMSWTDVWNHVSKLPIYHVYGTLGAIGIPLRDGIEHWGPSIISSHAGPDDSHDVGQVAALAVRNKWIRLASLRSSGVQESIDAHVQDLIRRSDRVVFLRFGFDAINVHQRLALARTLATGIHKAVIATAVGLPGEFQQQIQTEVGHEIESGGPNIKCFDFWRTKVAP